jgi:hypothetical protein
MAIQIFKYIIGHASIYIDEKFVVVKHHDDIEFESTIHDLVDNNDLDRLLNEIKGYYEVTQDISLHEYLDQRFYIDN